ncbi:MAG TPA: hypothetical protein VKZ18_26170 [Polyangia bacterium]|nr:hypothetical protein [Polyangia bacterium]
MASCLPLGAATLASGCYVGPAVPPPAYVDPGPGPAPAVAADGTVYPAEPPPDPIPEYQPPAPAYGYSWIGGYWDWTGYEWTWDAGYWAPADQAYLFIGPRFLFVDGRPVYYRPYWQGPGGFRAYGYGYRGVAPAAGWRARPSVAPMAWRAAPAHNEAWRRSPGAAGWRGAPMRNNVEPMRANPGFRPGAPAARSAPPPGGGFHPAPAAGGGFHPAPAGGGFHPAPAHAAPARGGGGGGRVRK